MGSCDSLVADARLVVGEAIAWRGQGGVALWARSGGTGTARGGMEALHPSAYLKSVKDWPFTCIVKRRGMLDRGVCGRQLGTSTQSLAALSAEVDREVMDYALAAPWLSPSHPSCYRLPPARPRPAPSWTSTATRGCGCSSGPGHWTGSTRSLHASWRRRGQVNGKWAAGPELQAGCCGRHCGGIGAKPCTLAHGVRYHIDTHSQPPALLRPLLYASAVESSAACGVKRRRYAFVTLCLLPCPHTPRPQTLPGRPTGA